MTIFTQGCHHHCPGCHNPQTHDFAGGHYIDIEEILAMIDENPLLDGVTFSGGDPQGTGIVIGQEGDDSDDDNRSKHRDENTWGLLW